MGVNFLDSMFPWICKAAGTETVYTNHCLGSTTIQKLFDAGLEVREIMSVTGHKCESSLQFYWWPNYNDRRCWSNVLASATAQLKCTCPEPNTSVPAKRSGNMVAIFR